MKTPKQILTKVLNEWDNLKDLDLMSILAERSLPFMEKAMKEYAKQEAIEFAKFIANYIDKDEHENGYDDNIQLIDGNYYWKDDEEGNHPLSEEKLYEMFLKNNKK